MNSKGILQNIVPTWTTNKSKMVGSFHIARNVYPLVLFKHRFAIEKRRAERLDSKCSLIVFNLEVYLSKNENENTPPNWISIEDLVKRICSKIRETDAICLHNPNVLLVLLPDTDHRGSENVCRNLVEQMMFIRQEYCKTNDLTHDEFEITILTYPVNNIDAKLSNGPEGALSKQEKMAAEEKSPEVPISNSVKFSDNHVDNLNICIRTSAISSDVHEILNTYYWDLQTVSSYKLLIENALKRAVDVLGASISLILYSPVMMITALLIKATSYGPILFRQRRLGEKGKEFTFLKFRSMYHNSEDSTHRDYVRKLVRGENEATNTRTQDDPIYKMEGDTRITPIGKFMRKTSIDELPQLWNVLKGEMSLVGPRPPIPYEVKNYRNWHYRRILEMKPGLTGLWQISGRSRTTFKEMVRLDINYAKNWSLFLDLKILLKTIKVVFKAEGM